MVAIRQSREPPAKQIKKTDISNERLRFSFEFFDKDDAELCPPVFRDGYTQRLMERLKALSTWTVHQFTNQKQGTVRNHHHDWSKTTRPGGFGRLPSNMRELLGWQFCLAENSFGRVHGVILDNTFFIVWLDHDHKLYPGQGTPKSQREAEADPTS